MSRIIEYPEKTGYTTQDYLLLDSENIGSRKIRADRVGVQIGTESGQAANGKHTQDAIDRIDADILELQTNKQSYIVDTATGSVASFPDGADDIPMVDVGVQIEPVQDLHGYDHPWPAGGGKNLLPMTLDYIKSINTGTWDGNVCTRTSGVTITVNTDNAGNVVGFTINGTMSRVDVFWLGPINATAGSYYLLGGAGESAWLRMSGPGKDTYTVQYVNKSVTVPTTVNITDDAELWGNIRLANDATLNNVVIKPYFGIEQPESFTPYSNICPITGWTGVNVNRTGKNLLNGVYTNEFVNEDGSIGTTQAARLSDYIYVGDNDFCISAKHIDGAVANGLRCCGYDENKKFIKLALISVSEGTAIVTRNSFGTDKNNIKYIRPNLFANSEDVNTWMAEYGTEPSEYVSPGTLYPITFPTEAGTVYGGTLDVTTGELVVDSELITLNGSETFWSNIATTRGVIRAYTTTFFSGRNVIVSDSLVRSNSSIVLNIIRIENGRLIVTPSWMQDVTTLAEFKTLLAEHNINIVVSLATPVTYQLTPTETTSFLGTNNLWADTGDSAVEYRADTKLYINKKIIEAISAAT